ncbi:hypothetical protein V7O66_03040 [Methanolobus sp. ZRKC3]|uniref:hypothetical protein n=1 Tax=Methanolobus sp. ZRKC3 TaxID=3125786 RepID=UPI00324BABEA
MEDIVPYLFILAIVTGALVFLILLNECIRWTKNLYFANKYLQKFTQFANLVLKRKFDEELYVWLTQNEPEIQLDLGVLGEFDHENGKYFIVSNAIPNLAIVGQGRSSFYQIDEAEKQSFNCKHALNRHIGLTKKYLGKALQDLFNPLKWLHVAILLPIHIFRWLGFKNSSLDYLEKNTVAKIMSGTFVLIQVVAAIITIFG